MQLSKILRTLMIKAKISEYALAKNTGIPQPMINKILNNKNTNPKISTLKPLADYFLVSTSQLLGEQEINHDVEEKFLHNDNQKIIKVPIIDWSDIIKCQSDEQVQTEEYVYTNIIVSKNSFALKVLDNIMSPRFTSNTIVIIEPNLTPKNKNYVLVRTSSNNCILRQLIFENDLEFLKCINPPDYTTRKQLLNYDEIIIGVIVEARNFYSM